MVWSLVAEYGLVQDRGSLSPGALRLVAPSYAEKSADGTYVIVDELTAHKGVPMRAECRTLRVDRHGTILYDSRARGIDDGDGRPIDGDRLALLRRTQWELQILDGAGEALERLALWSFSKRWPRFVSWTPAGTFLAVFLDRAHLLDIVEFDRRGRLLWYLPPGAAPVGVPTSLQLLSSDRLLVADEFRHVVVELDRDGRVVWRHGQPDQPSERLDALSSPRCARRLDDGRVLVADSRNHRVLLAGRDGAVEPFPVPRELLSSPASVQALPDARCLIADSGNGRVIEVDEGGRVVWQSGGDVAARRLLSFPRSAVPDGDGFLVADTANNRIVRAGPDGIVQEASGGTPLFWPRSARRTPTRSLLVADGRHSRIVEVDASGLLREVRTEVAAGAKPADPHDVRLLPNGRLLVVEPANDVVVEIDWSGTVHWSSAAIGVALDDPHAAQPLPDGTVLVCDTGHHRLVWLDAAGRLVRQLAALRSSGGTWRLNRPRYAELAPSGVLVISDTGNNRILGATPDGTELWEIARFDGSRVDTFDQPRWACLVRDDEVVVSDHYHHRIVHLRRTDCRDRYAAGS